MLYVIDQINITRELEQLNHPLMNSLFSLKRLIQILKVFVELCWSLDDKNE